VIIAGQSSTLPYLAFLRDKGLMFAEAGECFLMYGVQGRTWVALGDPVGRSANAPELVQQFLERCDDFDGIPVFYQVSAEQLSLYAACGLTSVKLGEEARVSLPGFALEGHAAKDFRQALRRLEREGCSFRVAPPSEVPALLPLLEAVSDDWLRSRGAAEKGFSLGFFEPSYLARFPVAIIERSGRIEAFANLWLGPGGTELSVDLMRYRASAPTGVMEGLLVQLMLWGRAEGYARFALGMAPLSGLDASRGAPLWTRLGSLVYRRAEAFYNFQGLRSYKEKFHPQWEPRYLAYPGGLGLPRILADVSALGAGGYRRIFIK
jgi:phosphatidylglycerol lysyltransferase